MGGSCTSHGRAGLGISTTGAVLDLGQEQRVPGFAQERSSRMRGSGARCAFQEQRRFSASQKRPVSISQSAWQRGLLSLPKTKNRETQTPTSARMVKHVPLLFLAWGDQILNRRGLWLQFAKLNHKEQV